MAKFAGKIGFIIPCETEPGSGIWIEESKEVKYRGDLRRRKFRYVSGDGANSNIQLSDELSIVADSFAKGNLGYMRYAIINDVKWQIIDAELAYPRINLSLGGVYNG